MIQTKAQLISKKYLVSDVALLTFSVEQGELAFSPGQYVILTIPTLPSSVKRLYSFASGSQSTKSFELLVKLVPDGAASSFLSKMSVGASLDVAGPAGLFLERQTERRKIYLATGTGFAPIRSFLKSRSPQLVNGELFWGFRTLSETYLLDELLSLKGASSHFSFRYCLSQQDSLDSIPADLLHYYRLGRINKVLEEIIPSIVPTDEYYLCGSRTVIESLRSLLLSRGVSKDCLFFEKY